jgi:hypothetical protein
MLQKAGVVFLVALLVHGADHLRRGFDVITGQVFWAGNVQLLLAVIAVTLVFRRHPLGPKAAVAIGLPSAIGFVAAHLLPHWSALSDSFTGSKVAPHVTGFSWFAALFEIAADLFFAYAGLQAIKAGTERAPALAM